VEFVSAGRSCEDISSMAQTVRPCRPTPTQTHIHLIVGVHYFTSSLCFLIFITSCSNHIPASLLVQAHQRLTSCHTSCTALAQSLICPTLAPLSSHSNSFATLRCLDTMTELCSAASHPVDALSPTFLPQLLAAVNKQDFAAASLMLPAIAAARTRISNSRQQDALHQAAQVRISNCFSSHHPFVWSR
jgi:hypothetical protein